jgi:hypothetical protein
VETLGTARLADEIPAERAVATIIPREEIAGALKDPDAQPELRLDITRKGEGGSDELGTVAITWSRESLEELLERATGDTVVLTFDRDELAQAFVDVEAHGLRERALVFAVVAAGAIGSSAAIANAMPITDPGQSSRAPATSVAPTDTMVTDASSGGGYSTPGAAADSMVTDASSGGGYSTPGTAADSMVTDASSGGGYTAAQATSADTRVTDASSGGGYGRESVTVSTPSAGSHNNLTDELIAGGVLLAIAGATFVGGRRLGTARPA